MIIIHYFLVKKKQKKNLLRHPECYLPYPQPECQMSQTVLPWLINTLFPSCVLDFQLQISTISLYLQPLPWNTTAGSVFLLPVWFNDWGGMGVEINPLMFCLWTAKWDFKRTVIFNTWRGCGDIILRLEHILCIMLYVDVKLYVYIGSVIPPFFMKGHIVTGWSWLGLRTARRSLQWDLLVVFIWWNCSVKGALHE